MTTQNENANYDFQSFEHYPQAQMYPAGWDLSEMQAESTATTVETNTSSTSEANS